MSACNTCSSDDESNDESGYGSKRSFSHASEESDYRSKRSVSHVSEDETEGPPRKKHKHGSFYPTAHYSADDSGEEKELYSSKNIYPISSGFDKKDRHSTVIKNTNSINYSDSYNDSEELGRPSFMSHHVEREIETVQPEIKGKESIGNKLMQRMGWKGQGLGKDGKGRIEPVQAAKQRGFRGLGFRIEELEKAHEKFDPNEEVIKVKEDIDWLVNDMYEEPFIENDWMKLGYKKLTIDDETEFCDPEIVSNVINSKTVFDRLDKIEMREARTRSNPFETIRSAFFINRAAVKMANMDRACDFMFTKPQNLKDDELLYFADVCAGPGGFSEYVLFRRQWRTKGFGFTLRKENDFKLDDFSAGPCETFHPYYGPREDGDVFWPENQLAFRDLIMKQTKEEGVHFMMSDGGFSVEGQENIQEILSKQLYLCQCLVALMIVRTGGHFVTKLFDIFTPFSAGLVYLMYRCFDEVSIFKPNTSRPANSERYLICKGKRSNTEKVKEYLFSVNKILQKRDQAKDVIHLVPLDLLKSENKFFYYLKNSNDELGRHQIVGLLKIAHYAQEKSLIEKRQGDMRKQCLDYWELPDKIRSVPRKMKPQEKIQNLLKGSVDILKKTFHTVKECTQESIHKTVLKSPLDWYCMPCASGKDVSDEKLATFYLGLGRAQVFRYVRNSWERVDKFILPADTLIYAESVTEFRKTGKQQRKAERLHILDAYFLGGTDISHMYLLKRHSLLKTFCEALWKPQGQECRLFLKDLYSVDEHLEENVTLQRCQMKNGSTADVYFPIRNQTEYHSEEDGNECPYFKPQSLIFMKATTDHWARHRSTKTGIAYFYGITSKQSFFENDRPSAAEADFEKTLNSTVVWHYPETNGVTMDYIMKYVGQALVKKKF